MLHALEDLPTNLLEVTVLGSTQDRHRHGHAIDVDSDSRPMTRRQFIDSTAAAALLVLAVRIQPLELNHEVRVRDIVHEKLHHGRKGASERERERETGSGRRGQLSDLTIRNGRSCMGRVSLRVGVDNVVTTARHPNSQVKPFPKASVTTSSSLRIRRWPSRASTRSSGHGCGYCVRLLHQTWNCAAAENGLAVLRARPDAPGPHATLH